MESRATATPSRIGAGTPMIQYPSEKTIDWMNAIVSRPRIKPETTWSNRLRRCSVKSLCSSGMNFREKSRNRP